MIIEIFKNTNFGNNELVWNVPHPNYDFSVHESMIFSNWRARNPLLTSVIVLDGNYDFNTTFYDYMIITDENNKKIYYFINSILAERNVLIFGVTLDAITTYNILSKPISGTIVRKHDTNINEDKFDYPTALTIQANYQNEYYANIAYDTGITRLIESTVNLTSVSNSVSINASDGSKIIVPTLPKPSHYTEYNIVTWAGYTIKDDNRAFTLYLADNVSENVLNTVRGLSGDGAISDSYVIPSDAVIINSVSSEVRNITAKFKRITTDMKLEIDFSAQGWQPKNEAIRGMFSIALISLQEKTKIEFPAWDLQNSVDENNYFKVCLWADPKPSGAPYCCPAEVKTLYPLQNNGVENPTNSLATLEQKSVRGGQWLRNPLIYSTNSGEIFSTIETQLQRERADYEKKVSLHQLELQKRERDINIAQADYNYQSGLASSLIGGGISLLSKDFSGAMSQAKNIIDGNVNQNFINQMRDLQSYQMETEKQLIKMAHTNNLKNLNIQETIRRVVPRTVVFEPNESMGSYEKYNSFMLVKIVPDIESLKAKDMEYSKYGYPVYESVSNFIMLNHLRANHTVYQFENPLIEIGGQVGDMIRTVLQSGIRILSKKYSSSNILNNPKVE